MKLTQPLADIYCKEQQSALEAQRRAEEIAFAPMVFQVSRLMVKFGILELLSQNRNGLTQSEIAEQTGFSPEEIALAENATASTESIHRQTGDDGFSLENILTDTESEEMLVEKISLRQAIIYCISQIIFSLIHHISA